MGSACWATTVCSLSQDETVFSAIRILDQCKAQPFNLYKILFIVDCTRIVTIGQEVLHLSQAYRLLSVKDAYAYGRPGMVWTPSELVECLDHLANFACKITLYICQIFFSQHCVGGVHKLTACSLNKK